MVSRIAEVPRYRCHIINQGLITIEEDTAGSHRIGRYARSAHISVQLDLRGFVFILPCIRRLLSGIDFFAHGSDTEKHAHEQCDDDTDNQQDENRHRNRDSFFTPMRYRL